MYKQVKIETQRLVLNPFLECHLTDNYLNWLNDKEVVQYSEQRHYVHDMNKCREYVKHYFNSDDWLLAICLKNSQQTHIGNVAVLFDMNNLTAEMSILIGEKEHWGNGYGQEAWEAVIESIFSTNIRKITAGAMSLNVAMLAILENSNMERDSVLERHYLYNGEEVDVYRYSIFKAKQS